MERHYLILDSKNIPLAEGEMLSPPGSQNIQLRILDDDADQVAEHEILHLINMGRDEPSLRCHLLRQRGDIVVLGRLATLDPELRRNLRVPVQFESFLYPLSRRWKGRQHITSIDLSCGGIAFYGSDGLEIGEQVEVVIPVTTHPLILKIQILRQQALKSRIYYAAKFVNMCRDEESMICEAVFSVQLSNVHRFKKGNMEAKR